MPDDPKGEQVVAPPPYEVKGGKVFIGGVDVTEIARFGEDDEIPEPEPEKEPNKDNAALEGDELDPEEKKEPAEVPKEEAKAPEKEPDKEPEPPKETAEEKAERLKFKLKFRGKEEEVEYDPSQIQVRLNKLRAFEENEKEFWEKRKEVEPYETIVKSEWFQKTLKEAYETGELTAPEAPPAPPATVQYEVMKRKADPDYESVMESLRDYARDLPPEAVRILDSDATVFLAEYDRIAKERKEKNEPPPPPVTKADPVELKKKLAVKESMKSRAEVVSPGTMSEPQSADSVRQKRIRVLERSMRDPTLSHRNIEFAAELIALRQNR